MSRALHLLLPLQHSSPTLRVAGSSGAKKGPLRGLLPDQEQMGHVSVVAAGALVIGAVLQRVLGGRRQ